MTIYEIDNDIQRILSQVDENGELPEAALDELMQLQADRDTKIENAACMVLDLLGDAKKIKEQEAVLKQRREAVEKRAERIKKYIEYATEGNPFSSERVTVKWGKSTAVEIDSAVFWENPDPAYVRVKQEVNRDAIKAALKEGADIPGAFVVERHNLSIK